MSQMPVREEAVGRQTGAPGTVWSWSQLFLVGLGKKGWRAYCHLVWMASLPLPDCFGAGLLGVSLCWVSLLDVCLCACSSVYAHLWLGEVFCVPL